MAASTATTSPPAAARGRPADAVAGAAGATVQACQPRIHAAMPRATSNPAPNPAWSAPPYKEAARTAS